MQEKKKEICAKVNTTMQRIIKIHTHTYVNFKKQTV